MCCFRYLGLCFVVACVGQDTACCCTAPSILDLQLFSLLQITDERNLTKTRGQVLLPGRSLGREGGALGSQHRCAVVSWCQPDCLQVPAPGRELPSKPETRVFTRQKDVVDALLVHFLAGQLWTDPSSSWLPRCRRAGTREAKPGSDPPPSTVVSLIARFAFVLFTTWAQMEAWGSICRSSYLKLFSIHACRSSFVLFRAFACCFRFNVFALLMAPSIYILHWKS